MVLLPTVTHGYTPHHMDFPGPITIGWETFVKYCVDIGTSLARHGFRRILFLNGHGSNIPLCDMAARLIGLEHPDVLAATAFYLTSEDGRRVVAEVRDSERGGMGHACELETSIYLAIDPDAVDMSKAVDENSFPEGPNSWMDWDDGPLHIMPWWNAISRTGVHGDATKATAEKGRAARRRGCGVRGVRPELKRNRSPCWGQTENAPGMRVASSGLYPARHPGPGAIQAPSQARRVGLGRQERRGNRMKLGSIRRRGGIVAALVAIATLASGTLATGALAQSASSSPAARAPFHLCGHRPGQAPSTRW